MLNMSIKLKVTCILRLNQDFLCNLWILLGPGNKGNSIQTLYWLNLATAGLSIRASGRPKLLASWPSLAGYFHILLPQLPTKNRHHRIKFPVLNDTDAYLNRFRSVKRSNRSMSWNTWDILTALFLVLCVFWWNNMASAVENPWKCHFWDSLFQNIPRCLGPQELLPLVRVPKPPTLH